MPLPQGQADAARRSFSSIPIHLDDFNNTVAGEATINFTGYGVEYRGTQRERRRDDPHVEIVPPPAFLTADELQLLAATVTVDYSEGIRDDDSKGVEPSWKVLVTVAEILDRRDGTGEE